MRSTALRQFQRLEAPGSWRPAPNAQLREVVVSIGEATLILSDPKSDAPLTHWSLPAIQRVNPGATPAVYTPVTTAEDAGYETLEIDDRWMIDAINRVQAAIAARRPHPGRLRGSLTATALAVMVLAGIIWLPDALRAHAVRITPAAERAQIGLGVLGDMTRSTGQPCADPAAAAALHGLVRRMRAARWSSRNRLSRRWGSSSLRSSWSISDNCWSTRERLRRDNVSNMSETCNCS